MRSRAEPPLVPPVGRVGPARIGEIHDWLLAYFC